MTQVTLEANFDGLVGPTHNYAGLSYGNVASEQNLGQSAAPKQAALQGLAKMKALADMGLFQAVLPPQQRPDMSVLRRLGFAGSDAQILKAAAQQDARLLAAVYSASSMWVANAATISPSADTADGRVHMTVANLVSKFHRSIEVSSTQRALTAIFPAGDHFALHAALPAVALFGDEGAANHTRLCAQYDQPGLELFVYGQDMNAPGSGPQRYPARQTLQASQAIARLHQLSSQNTVFLQQNPAVIDQGVFHNDVIAVGNKNLLFFHERAFVQHPSKLLPTRINDQPLRLIEVPDQQISVRDAVASYLFNSQLLSLPGGESLLVVPAECQRNQAVWDYLQQLVVSQNGIDRILVFDLTQSMRNGGGPACLRLRVVLTPEQQAAVNPGVVLTDRLYRDLCSWVQRHYRDTLAVSDLADPALLTESCTALDELTQLLRLGSIYPFQNI